LWLKVTTGPARAGGQFVFSLSNERNHIMAWWWWIIIAALVVFFFFPDIIGGFTT
jgi:hypothetical protein